MKILYLKFPNQQKFDQFRKYIILEECKEIPEKLILSCKHDPIALRIASEMFGAVILDQANTL